MESSLSLEAPCQWCGYTGLNYWRAGSHPGHCIWHQVGGQAERAAIVRWRDEVRGWRKVAEYIMGDDFHGSAMSWQDALQVLQTKLIKEQLVKSAIVAELAIKLCDHCAAYNTRASRDGEWAHKLDNGQLISCGASLLRKLLP